MKKNRISSIDCLRLFAIFGVILIHVTAENLTDAVIDSKTLQNNFINGLVHSYSVPIFVMISGYLLLDNKNFNYKSLLKKYLPRIIICLSFWHYVYYFYRLKKISFNIIIEATKKLLLGKTYSHLWYLYLIIGLYLITPILKKLVANLTKKDYIYLLTLGFTITSLLPTINKLFNIDTLKYIVPYHVFEFSIFTFYYLLGNYYKKYKVKKQTLLLIISSILIICISFYGNYISVKNNTLTNYLDNNSIFGLLFSISIFSIFLNSFEKIEKKYITELGRLTFGVYLIHFIVEKALLNFGINSNMINPLFGSIIVTLIISIISYSICYVISKIPYLKKVIL